MIISYAAQLVLTLMLLIFLKPLSVKLGLVDIPKGRKQHKKHVPLVGGIAVYLAATITTVIFFPDILLIVHILLLSGILVGLSIWDDLKELSVKVRVGMQIIVIVVLYFIFDIHLESFGNILYFNINLGLLALPVMVIAGLGFINAINMIDGLDGLSSGLSIISFSFIGISTWLFNGQSPVSILCGLLVISLLVFICFNLSEHHKVFLGDAGSIFLGFILFSLIIAATQKGDYYAFRPVTALWFTAVPLMDTVSVMVRRIKQGNSPFFPDRQHIHHIVQKKLGCKWQTLFGIYMVAIIAGLYGLLGEYLMIPAYVQFALFLIIFLVYYKLTSHYHKVMDEVV